MARRVPRKPSDRHRRSAFQNTRRAFYQNVNNLPLKRGDIVAVEASPGHDIGIVSLTGDLVAQMRRTGFNPFNGELRRYTAKPSPTTSKSGRKPSN